MFGMSQPGKQLFGVTYAVKDYFFDRPAVKAMIDGTTDAAMSRAGSFIRRTARSLIGRPARRPLPPRAAGQPPRARNPGEITTLRNILFAYDRHKHSVVVGPVRLNGKQYVGGRLIAGTIPALHEFGGRVGFREKLAMVDEVVAGPAGRDSRGRFTKGAREKREKWIPAGRRRARPGQPVRVRMATYHARPFMGPALAKNAPKFPELWGGTGGGFRGAA